MENAKKLIKDVEKKIDNWNERSQFKMKTVGNLSFSDMETLKFYAEEKLKRGNINHLMEPRGGIGEVLSMYGIKKEATFWG